jgi:hypothetical protein
MTDLCEHNTFSSICNLCHRDNIITRLRAENERLRAALGEIHAVSGTNNRVAQLARAALEEK